MMTWRDWLRPGIGMKRWGFLGLAGFIVFDIFLLWIWSQGITKDSAIFLFLGMIIGIFIMYMAVTKGCRAFFRIVNKNAYVNIDREKISNMIYERRVLNKAPKVVVIGGGTGLSTMLRGLKHHTSNITAVVTVADNGGGSGVLRQEMKILPPGDIRNCILALANTEPIMEDLLQYRFTEGSLKGQSFGNLFLAAMNGISENFEEAVKKMSEVLAITGKVLPVTLEDVNLCATLQSGEIVCGESEIVEQCKTFNQSIESISLQPENVKPLPEVLQAIKEADLVVLGPGSLYTSIIPNLLVKEVAKAIKSTKAKVVYVANVMTQPGETTGYDVYAHIEAIEKHIGKNVIECVIANKEKIPIELKKLYAQEYAQPVEWNKEELEAKGYKMILEDILSIHKGYVRHNPKVLAKVITSLFVQND